MFFCDILYLLNLASTVSITTDSSATSYRRYLAARPPRDRSPARDAASRPDYPGLGPRSPPPLRRYISEPDAAELVRWVPGSATVVVDPEHDPPVHSRDPDDDYLIALASAHRAALVSGDKHLLALEGEIPVFSPRAFLDLLVRA